MQEGGQARVQRRHELIRAMHNAGVSMMAGTDAMLPYVVSGFRLHDELALLVSTGLTPFASLRSATLGPAQFLGVTAEQELWSAARWRTWCCSTPTLSRK